MLSVNQKLMLRVMKGNRMTSKEIAAEVGITHHAVNTNIRFLRASGHLIRICKWESTGGRARPVYEITEQPKRDVPEPKQKKPSYYSTKSYYRRRARESRVLAAKRGLFVASPWDGFQDIRREAA